jgi:hypothetical protein
MVESPSSPDANLVEFLSARARGATDGRLALDAGIGFVAAIVALIWRPAGWHIVACVGACFMAFGGWGIADRELREATESELSARWLGVGRAIAAGLGALAAGILLLSLLGFALGTWIS